MSDETRIVFRQPEPWELDVYHHVARGLVERHLAERPADPVVGLTFDFGRQEVGLAYRELDGTETVPGATYPGNAVKSRPVGGLLRAARELKGEGML